MMNQKYPRMQNIYDRTPGFVGSRDGYRRCRGNGSPLNNRSVRDGVGCGCGRMTHPTAKEAPVNLRVPSVEEGCGCGCGDSQHQDCAKLLKQIQTVDFALYEVILYLDAYPDQCEALDLYHKLLDRRHMLATAYEEACGPLTPWGNVSKTSWDWVKTPAPWEYPND